MDSKEPIEIKPVEFVAPVDDVYNPLIGGWERKAPIVTKSELIACVAVVLTVFIIFGVSLWI